MHMKGIFQLSDLEAILAAELSRQLNRPVRPLDIVGIDTDEAEIEDLDVVALDFEFADTDSSSPQDVLHLCSNNQEVQPA